MIIIAQLAQVAIENQALYTYGPMGIVLGWFMWRGEKVALELRALAHRIDGMTRAMLVDMLERESAGTHVKDYCRKELANLDARAERKK